MNDKETLNKDYEKIKEDYLPNDNDDDRLRDVKDAMKLLTPAELKIWLTYVEYGTYSDTAKEYNVSAPTAKTYIQRIKNKLIDIMDKND